MKLDDWDSLNAVGREDVARALAARDERFTFIALESHRLGPAAHEIAHFAAFGSEFVLIPGADATLGYDRAAPFVPNEAQRQSFAETTDEYGVVLEHLLDKTMAPHRRVSIAPFLLEVSPVEVGREFDPRLGITVTRCQSHRRVAESLHREGLRMPTADEWEYAERGDSPTLFRWGDDCPCDAYPAGDREAEEQPFQLHRCPNAFGLRINWTPYVMGVR